MAAEILTTQVNNTPITIIYEYDANLPIVSYKLTFKGSGYLSDGEKQGLSKLTTSLLNEGTRKLGATKFAEELESRAISLDVSGGAEEISFSIDTLKEQFPYALTKLSHLLNDPNFTAPSFEKIKQKTISRILAKGSDFDNTASELLDSMIYKNTPLATPPSGTTRSVEKLTLEDTKAFYKHHFGLNNVIVVVGGDIAKEEAIGKTIELLTPLKSTQPYTKQRFDANNASAYKEVTKKTEQAYIYFGSPYAITPSSADAYKSNVASYILGGGGFGSRLMEEIRVKRGLAYSAYGRVINSSIYSAFEGYLQTKLKSKDEAVKLVKEVVLDFSLHGATQKELDGARKFLIGSEPLRNEKLSQRLGRAYSEFTNDKPLGSTKEELLKIETLTLDELNAFIQSHAEINALTFAVVTK